MKRLLLLFLLLTALLLSSCQAPELEQNRSIYLSYCHDSFGSMIYGPSYGEDLPDSIELSDLIILGTVKSKTDLNASGKYPSAYSATFEYEITIDEIFYDRRSGAEVGDTITLRTGCGYMLCSEFHRLVHYEEKPDPEPSENDYYAFHLGGMIPFEVGRQFVILLDDANLAEHGHYTSGTRTLNWCYESGYLYHGAEAEIWDGDLTDLRDLLALAVSLRRGIYDEGIT